jgi:hypothetical protein
MQNDKHDIPRSPRFAIVAKLKPVSLIEIFETNNSPQQ